MQLLTLIAILAVLTSGQAAVLLNRAASVGILPTLECPEDTGPVVIIAPSVGDQPLSANQYVVCFQGKPLIFNCSEGLFFNWSTMSCDFPYEARRSSNSTSSSDGGLGDLDLIPVGPIQVPVSPQWPVPIWTRGGISILPYPPQVPVPPQIPPRPQYPITKPDPAVIMPIPVLPPVVAHPPPLVPRPVPYQLYY